LMECLYKEDEKKAWFFYLLMERNTCFVISKRVWGSHFVF
jgi:hypothetical protein